MIEELFDILDDPYEENNLIDKDEFKEIYKLLSGKLEVFVEMVGK